MKLEGHEGLEVERGRPRTRRIIARVILPRCELALASSYSVVLILVSVWLCLLGPHWIPWVCVRELTSACKRSLA